MKYKIEVSMTPINGYYRWYILYASYADGWNIWKSGLGESPQEAWQNAYLWYDDITANQGVK